MTSLQKGDIYFKSLTGVRAIAAYMVYIHHLNPIPKKFSDSYFYNFAQELHVGVTMFFVLSGFLIAYRYLDTSNFNFKKFMVNRIARIYPMYFILTTLTFLVYGFLLDRHDYRNFGFYILNISFLRGYFDSFKFSAISQGWSLTVEETFYILAPLIFILIKKNKLYLFLLPISIICFGVSLVLICSRMNFYGFFSSFEFMFNYTFFGRCLEFFIGVALAIVYKNDLLKSKFRFFTYSGVICIIVSIFFISLLKGNSDFGIRHPFGKLINTFILPLFGIATFYYGLLREKTFISDVLSSNVFVLLGKSSYIFYLIHVGIFSILLYKIIPNYIIIFLTLNILSIILYNYIEEPLNVYIRKKFA